MNQEIKKIFCDLLGEDRVFTDEPMKQHTTFKIGGPADYFLVPESGEEAGNRQIYRILFLETEVIFWWETAVIVVS